MDDGLMDAERWTAAWRPRRPLATDDLATGCYRMGRDQALDRRYLEHSPSALQTMLVIDVDHDDTLLRALSRPLTHPEPSWVAESISGRGHVGWILQTPVCRTDSGRPKPLAFAAKVEEGLRRALDGDVGYTGPLTKNPTHAGWATTWGRADPWELRDLAHALGELMPRSLPRRTVESSGLGRNVTLFNVLRLWSYPRRRHYGDRAEWEGVVEAMALAYNDQFSIPLPAPEVGHTATSVARWTWRNLTAEGFRAVQAARGRKGGQTNTPAQRAARLRNLPGAKLDQTKALEVLT